MAEIKLIATDSGRYVSQGWAYAASGRTPRPYGPARKRGLEYAPVRGATGQNAEKLWKRSGLTTFVR